MLFSIRRNLLIFIFFTINLFAVIAFCRKKMRQEIKGVDNQKTETFSSEK